MRYFQKIVGENIYLSPINPEDVEQYTEWINDPEISINLGVAANVFSLLKERETLERMAREGHNFAIIEIKHDRLLGNCSLMDVDLINRKAELGIFIGNKQYWNRGFGREAIMLLLDYGFNILNLNNIMLKVFSFNQRAINCYKKCGFKEIGRRREAKIIGNKKYDDIYMDILAEEFKTSVIEKYVESE